MDSISSASELLFPSNIWSSSNTFGNTNSWLCNGIVYYRNTLWIVAFNNGDTGPYYYALGYIVNPNESYSKYALGAIPLEQNPLTLEAFRGCKR